jgi:sporulation protein YlmC with PRC-barrel domain
MKRHAPFDLIRDLLDHELLDSDGVSCGMVDDVELQRRDDGVVIAALLVGPGVWSRRLPAALRVLARALGADRRTRVAFEQVESISEVIKLKSRATDLGLGIADRHASRRLARIAGSS